MNLLVNNEAIIFLDIDRINNYHTIAYDWQTDNIMAIRPKEYLLLRHVWGQNGIEESAIKAYRSQYLRSQKEVDFVVSKLIEKKLLIPRNG